MSFMLLVSMFGGWSKQVIVYKRHNFLDPVFHLSSRNSSVINMLLLSLLQILCPWLEFPCGDLRVYYCDWILAAILNPQNDASFQPHPTNIRRAAENEKRMIQSLIRRLNSRSQS